MIGGGLGRPGTPQRGDDPPAYGSLPRPAQARQQQQEPLGPAPDTVTAGSGTVSKADQLAPRQPDLPVRSRARTEVVHSELSPEIAVDHDDPAPGALVTHQNTGSKQR